MNLDMYNLPSNMKSSSHKTWKTSLISETSPNTKPEEKKVGWDMACYIPPSWKSGGATFPMSPPNRADSDTSWVLCIDISAVAIPDRNCCRMHGFKGSHSCHKVKQQTSLQQWSIIKHGFWKCNTIETKHSASAAYPNKQASLPISWAYATKQFKRLNR